MNKQSTGAAGEKIAANFLRKNGFDILEMNFKNDFGRKMGEIDIIAKDKKTKELVFVEVKSRSGVKYANSLPEENITPSKLRKLAKISQHYLRKNRHWEAEYRFDAVSVWLDWEKKTAKIKHLRNIYL